MKRYLAAMIVLTTAAFLAGCGSDTQTTQVLERMLPRLAGPAQRYEVKPSGLSSDRMKAARIDATRLQATETLVLDQARLDLSEVRFDRDRQELLSVARADFSAILLQEDLNLYLRDRTALMKTLRLRLTPQGAQIVGAADIPGVKLPFTPEFTMDGALAIDELGRLSFEPRGIRVVGAELPSVAAKVLATQINPLVDLSHARLPVTLRSVDLGPGEVRLTGRAQVRVGHYPAP